MALSKAAGPGFRFDNPSTWRRDEAVELTRKWTGQVGAGERDKDEEKDGEEEEEEEEEEEVEEAEDAEEVREEESGWLDEISEVEGEGKEEEE